jgi:hypothetical protein
MRTVKGKMTKESTSNLYKGMSVIIFLYGSETRLIQERLIQANVTLVA